jgi:programmed cell death 6-interacting protein
LNNCCVQEAIGKIKQQCSDFVMTRNIQCREMIEDVQRKLAGFNFSSSSHTSLQRNSSVPPEQSSPSPPPHVQPPYSAPHGGDSRAGYSQPEPRLHTHSHTPHPMARHTTDNTNSHDYGQPAYPGWRGPYYNAHQPRPQQPGPYPQPPYNAPGSYPSHQNNYYGPR